MATDLIITEVVATFYFHKYQTWEYNRLARNPHPRITKNYPHFGYRQQKPKQGIVLFQISRLDSARLVCSYGSQSC